jgi:hypothetical protein
MLIASGISERIERSPAAYSGKVQQRTLTAAVNPWPAHLLLPAARIIRPGPPLVRDEEAAGSNPATPTRSETTRDLRRWRAHAPRAAAVMFRRTLEAVVRSSGSANAVETLDKKNLAAALSVMAAEHTLDPALAQWAKELRLVGNLGGHFDPLDDVQMDEAEEMSRLARGLFTYLYEMPAKLARSRATGSTTQP